MTRNNKTIGLTFLESHEPLLSLTHLSVTFFCISASASTNTLVISFSNFALSSFEKVCLAMMLLIFSATPPAAPPNIFASIFFINKF